MTGITNISRVYFIGIGGIGMSAVARYFLSQGAKVEGYDKTPTHNTEQLIEEGAAIHFTDDVSLIDKEAQLVIYTPAVPKDHTELRWYADHQYNLKKRSEVLGEITANGFNICIAGTHGKTTMTTLTAFILQDSSYGCNAFLGGISVNYNTNFWRGDNQVNVVEADEYDRSFLNLNPTIAVISSMDPDHLDIYGSVENMRDAFFAFADKIKKNGLLIQKFGLKINDSPEHRHLTYSLQNNSADVYAENILMKDGGYFFDVVTPSWRIDNCRLNMGGMHNVENAVASICIAHELKIAPEKIRTAVEKFNGVKRRFEYIISLQESKVTKANTVYIDDYAHHPAELKALLTGVRSLFNNRRITVIFQPHLYSRTRDLYKEFAEALSIANKVILMPVYPARELPIPGVSSELIAGEMEAGKVMIMEKEEILSWIQDSWMKMANQSGDGEVLVTAGAGDIDQLVGPIKQILLNF